MCIDEIPQETLFSKTLPTILSSLVVLILFFIGRKIDSIYKKEETRIKWYFAVIIEPNISKVDVFINDIFSKVKDSINDLIIAKKSKNVDDYLIIKSSKIGEFQEIKREFEFDFIELIRSNNPEIARELSKYLIEFEDAVTTTLDDINLNKNSISNAEKKIRKFKGRLFSILYTPIKNPQVTLYKHNGKQITKNILAVIAGLVLGIVLSMCVLL